MTWQVWACGDPTEHDEEADVPPQHPLQLKLSGFPSGSFAVALTVTLQGVLGVGWQEPETGVILTVGGLLPGLGDGLGVGVGAGVGAGVGVGPGLGVGVGLGLGSGVGDG